LIERYENKREGIEQRFVLLAGEPGTVTIGGRIAGFEAEVHQVPDGLILA
jgi:hypothetical protein